MQFKERILIELANAYCTFTCEDLSQPNDGLSPEFLKTVSAENIDAFVLMYWSSEPVAIGTLYTPGEEHPLYISITDDVTLSPYAQELIALYRTSCQVDPDEPIAEAYSNQMPYIYEGRELLYACSVPEIQCDSDYANEVNRELSEYYLGTFDAAGNWLGANMSYEWHISGDILSLVVYLFDTEYTTNLEPGWPNRVYNIHMSDGSRATTDEVLQVAGVSKEGFRTRVREFLGSYFLYFAGGLTWKEILEDPEAHAEEIHLTHFKVTVGEDNLDRAIPYFTENGELHFTGRVYCPIGGYVFETPMSSRYDNFEVSAYYEDMLKLVTE